jgi:hypothetical protein
LRQTATFTPFDDQLAALRPRLHSGDRCRVTSADVKQALSDFNEIVVGEASSRDQRGPPTVRSAVNDRIATVRKSDARNKTTGR